MKLARLSSAALAFTIGTGAAAQVPPAAVDSTKPFGPGTPVQLVSTKPVRIYVARLVPGAPPPTNYDFVKVGGTPASFQLPPGRYLLDVENTQVTSEEVVLNVGTEPVNLQVKAGSSDMATLGALTLGVGIVCVLTATVLLISTANGPSRVDKVKIAVPLYVAGGALAGGGVGLYFASRTSIEPPEARATTTPPRAFLAGVRVAF